MKSRLEFVGIIFLYLLSLGFLTGCSELQGLRIANRRQAITIRDQIYEIDSLTDRLEMRSSVSTKPKSSAQKVHKGKDSVLEPLTELRGSGVTSQDTDEGLAIQLPEDLLFDSASTVLTNSADAILGRIADYLREKPLFCMRISVYGQLVSERQKWVSDHHFSAQRALSLLHYLIEEESIDPQRMFIAGYGSHEHRDGRLRCGVKVPKGRVEFLIFE